MFNELAEKVSITRMGAVMMAVLMVGSVLAAGVGTVAAQSTDDTTIELGVGMDGFDGVSAGINGVVNPTLNLTEGQNYTIKFTNQDGLPHDFAIVNESGDTITQTDMISETGATGMLNITATTEMAGYVDTAHPDTASGNINVTSTDDGGADDGSGDDGSTDDRTDTGDDGTNETDDGTDTNETDETTYPVSFNVSHNDTAVENATISVGNETVETDANGSAVASLPDGDYDYSISADGYESIEDNVTVNGSAVELTNTLTEETDSPGGGGGDGDDGLGTEAIAILGAVIMVLVVFAAVARSAV